MMKAMKCDGSMKPRKRSRKPGATLTLPLIDDGEANTGVHDRRAHGDVFQRVTAFNFEPRQAIAVFRLPDSADIGDETCEHGKTFGRLLLKTNISVQNVIPNAFRRDRLPPCRI